MRRKNTLLKNLSYPNRKLRPKIKGVSVLLLTLLCHVYFAQVGNYVANGSFESIYNCTPPVNLDKAKYWCNIGFDSTKFAGFLYSTGPSTDCINAPYTDVGFQYPKSGRIFYRLSPYCVNLCSYYFSRGYPKNRLKANLKANTTYCVKMYVSRQNECPYAISNLSFYFGDNTSDTIKYANGPITYLNPQVKNPLTNIIVDTMNWVPVTGTFVATGTEKYLVIGNFESNATTTHSLVDTSWGNGVWAEYFVDDVSCIEMDLPAYAGPDKAVRLGDSVYIGREPDFAIDSGCTWYKFPNMGTPINISSGLWVKPTVTSTYIVKQVLDCSAEKWDTVVIYMNPLHLNEEEAENSLHIFPNPADDFIEIKNSNPELLSGLYSVSIYNHTGQLIREEDILFGENKIILKTNLLENGVYFIHLKSSKTIPIIKRFVVAR